MENDHYILWVNLYSWLPFIQAILKLSADSLNTSFFAKSVNIWECLLNYVCNLFNALLVEEVY